MDEDGNYVVAGNSVIGESLVEKDELLKRLLPTAIDAPNVKWGDHLVDRSITHDHRGKGTVTPIEPFLIGEFKYRSINYSEKPVYRLENDRFVQVGTKRAPTLQQATFGRWRTDKELTPHDLRMGQVAAEGQGKWLKNPWPFTINTAETANLRNAKKWNDWVLKMKLATLDERQAQMDELKSKMESGEISSEEAYYMLVELQARLPRPKANPPEEEEDGH